MSRKLLLVFALLIMAMSKGAIAQDSTHKGIGCPFSAAKLWDYGISGTTFPEAIARPYEYPLSARDTCGKIVVYYEDIKIALSGSFAKGFAEPAGVGLRRRNTICAVMNYIQSVFDFRSIPAGQYLRIEMAQSNSDTFHSGGAAGALGVGYPYFDTSHKMGDTVNGFFHDFVMSGIDPLNLDSGFHAYLQFNFDSINLDISKWATGVEDKGFPRMLPYNDGLDLARYCEHDMYSAALHFMGHVMGWLQWVYDPHYPTDFVYKKFVSKHGLALYGGPPFEGVYDPLDPSLLLPELGTVWTGPIVFGPIINLRPIIILLKIMITLVYLVLPIGNTTVYPREMIMTM